MARQQEQSEYQTILKTLQSLGICKKILVKQRLSGGMVNQTFKLTTDKGDLLLKINRDPWAYDFFIHEKESLEAINRVIPNFAPIFLAMGKLPTKGFFLLTSYLAFTKPSSAEWVFLAKKVAKLHSIKSPNGKFGFSSGINNQWRDSWEEFFIENKLKTVLEGILQKYPEAEEFKNLGKIIVNKVAPTLLHNLKVEPVLIHGDLWRENWGVSSKTNEPVVWDPTSYYACNEMEFSAGSPTTKESPWTEFLVEYHKYHPRQELRFWERQDLYRLYQCLGCYWLFGQKWRKYCLKIMRSLVQLDIKPLSKKEK